MEMNKMQVSLIERQRARGYTWRQTVRLIPAETSNLLQCCFVTTGVRQDGKGEEREWIERSGCG